MSLFGIEPSADSRAGARALWQMYVALIQEGFSENQAMYIVATMVTATITAPPNQDPS